MGKKKRAARAAEETAKGFAGLLPLNPSSPTAAVVPDLDPFETAVQGAAVPEAALTAESGLDPFETAVQEALNPELSDDLAQTSVFGEIPPADDPFGIEPNPFQPQVPAGDDPGTVLNPLDLVSNLTDLINPASNPGIGGALTGLQLGELGGLVGNDVLLNDVTPTFQEGLATGFKPDLQPVIDDAMRRFFGDIVPQLGQNNVALQQGVGPFSSDLNASLLREGGNLASELGALEVQNQNLAGDRRSGLLGISNLIGDQLFNSSTTAGRNTLNLGESIGQLGTVGGRQANMLSFLNQLMSGSPIQANSSSNSNKSGGGGIG